MRANEFTTEDGWDDYEDSENEYNAMERTIASIAEKYDLTNEQVNFAWKVKEECQPYLNQNPGAMSLGSLYRGIHSSQNTIKKKVRLDDRKPLDSSNGVHDELNNRFTEYYGEPFRNALFVSNDIRQAENYGEIYIIFPIGNFRFLWSPDVEDIFSLYEMRDPGKTDEDFVAELISGNKYYTENLIPAINSGNEIMIRCNNYYGLRKSALTQLQLSGIRAIINL